MSWVAPYLCSNCAQASKPGFTRRASGFFVPGF